MQNRRIVDAALRDAGVEAASRVEANSISALLSFAQTGWSCVMAQTWLALQGKNGIYGLSASSAPLPIPAELRDFQRS